MNVSRVLIANRGEIAVRVIRACRSLGIDNVLAVSEADRDSLAARLAGRAVCIGPASPGESYLNIKAIVAAAQGTGSDAVHPGYGFLAESPQLAEACARRSHFCASSWGIPSLSRAGSIPISWKDLISQMPEVRDIREGT